MRRALISAGLTGAVALATTWPWAMRPTRAPGARDLEAGDHLWALWLAAQEGGVVARTTLVGAPEGYTWVVGDPAHVPIFALGHALGGGGLGLALVQLLAIGLAALAGWAWARELWLDRPAAAVWAAPLAAAAPGLGIGVVTGMTEAQPLGLTALALLAVLRLARTGAVRDGLLCALAFGALPWFGAYPALYGLLLAPIALAAGLAAPGPRARRLAGVGAAAAAAALLAAPIAHAVLSARDPGLPGGTALTAQVLADPDLPLNRMLGADLLGLVFPGADLHPTGVHGAYLGLGTCGAALWGLAQAPRRRWATAALAGAAAALSLGFFVQAGGAVLRLDGAPLLAPAGALSLLVEGLGRAPRWTRMATLAAILLAPLAAAGLEDLRERLEARSAGSPRWLGGLVAALLLGLCTADAVRLGPAPWPRPTFSVAPPPELAELDAPGALLELPAPRYSTALPEIGGGPRARLRHPTLLWQTGHGRALSGNPHQAGLAEGAGARLGRSLLDAALAADADALAAHAATARQQGFAWAVAWKGVSTAAERRALTAAWGPPIVDGPALSAWALPR
jgi:hypothetical protein